MSIIARLFGKTTTSTDTAALDAATALITRSLDRI